MRFLSGIYLFLGMLVLTGALLLAGCADEGPPEEPTEPPTDMPANTTVQMAVAQLQPTKGNKVTGRITFSAAEEGINIVADVKGLSPGRHAIHITENGDCSSPDASSAGSHFNPYGASHGSPEKARSKRHVGDLGNIEADSSGTALYDRTDKLISFEGESSIVDRAVIVHSGSDDLESQPSGNAGQRVACGVIRMQGGTRSDTSDTSDTTQAMQP